MSAASAWAALCRDAERLGAGLDDEGVSHLVEQMVCFLGWSVLHADPRRPAFQRQNDLASRWGGPNADNVYRHARVDPSHRYRIVGKMHSCEDFILAVRAGFMHMETWGTLHQVTASDLGIGENDEISLSLGGDDPAAIPLPEGAVMVSIREYYFDWRPLEPATFTIECLDPDRTPAPAMTPRLEDALEHVERSMRYWDGYLADARSRQEDNSFASSLQVARGLAAARYAYCFWNLQPGEALYIESDVPAARYWSFQLYNLRWFESIDLDSRITSRNHRQTTVSPDGRVRVVVAPDDPGAPNWVDTGGRPEGLLMLRWFWPQSETAPSPSARVVRAEDVNELIGGEPRDRNEEIRARFEHLGWRFRT